VTESIPVLGPAKSWKVEAEQLTSLYKRDKDIDDEANAIHTREYLCSQAYKSQSRTSGEELYDHIIADLNRLGLVRTKYQKQFHEAAMHACLYWIYGPEYERLRRELMRRLNLPSINSEVLCITPRRYGKTTMVAMFAAVMLMRIPGLQIAIFSTGKRASQAMMQKIVVFVKKLKGGAERIVARNDEHLYIAASAQLDAKGNAKKLGRDCKDDATTSHLMSFPANENGNLTL